MNLAKKDDANEEFTDPNSVPRYHGCVFGASIVTQNGYESSKETEGGKFIEAAEGGEINEAFQISQGFIEKSKGFIKVPNDIHVE